MQRELAFRNDPGFLFAVPPGDFMRDLQSSPPDQISDDTLDRIAGGVQGDVEAALPAGASTRLRLASCGRGAESLGVAIDLLMGFGSLYGGYAAIKDTAEQVRKCYDAVCRRLGRRPLVSLGTARALAAAEVATRLGHDDFALLGSGDTASESPDRSFTGEDTFWVIFHEDAVLHVCIVEADGRVHLLGDVHMHDNWKSRFRYLYGDDSVLPESDDPGSSSST